MSKILVVEDEAKIARFIELELTHEGYEVDKAEDGRAGIAAALSGDYDLILLDLALPQLNGMEVLRRLRKEKDTPVIVLTARDAVMDKVAGLDAGADDYITKPFAIEELLARIRVALKRRENMRSAGIASAGSTAGAPAVPAAPIADSSNAASVQVPASAKASASSLQAQGLSLDSAAHEASIDGVRLDLTNREFEILRVLMENRGIVMSREKLLHLACGYEFIGETNLIDVNIAHIRAKIEACSDAKPISTVRGVGYVIR